MLIQIKLILMQMESEIFVKEKVHVEMEKLVLERVV